MSGTLLEELAKMKHDNGCVCNESAYSVPSAEATEKCDRCRLEKWAREKAHEWRTRTVPRDEELGYSDGYGDAEINCARELVGGER